MRILKKAQQKNFIINSYYYTESGLNELVQEGIAHKIDEGDTEYRVYADDCDRVEIKLDEDGYYTAVAMLKSGQNIYIEVM